MYILKYFRIHILFTDTDCINCVRIWNMSVNIRQHKAYKNTFTRQRSKTKQKSKQSFTRVKESITPGQHA